MMLQLISRAKSVTKRYELQERTFVVLHWMQHTPCTPKRIGLFWQLKLRSMVTALQMSSMLSKQDM
jgi:hypothetical protein